MNRDLATSTIKTRAGGMWERTRRALLFGATSAVIAGIGMVLLGRLAQGGQAPVDSFVTEAANLVAPALSQSAEVRPYAIVMVGDEAQARRLRDHAAQADSLVAATGRVSMSIDVIVVPNSADGAALVQQLLANDGLLASIGREPVIVDLRNANA